MLLFSLGTSGVYKTNLISTIVDLQLDNPQFNVYKTNLISTIVDTIGSTTKKVDVYKTNLISTIVDYLT